jgi:hypothetical protein
MCHHRRVDVSQEGTPGSCRRRLQSCKSVGLSAQVPAGLAYVSSCRKCRTTLEKMCIKSMHTCMFLGFYFFKLKRNIFPRMARYAYLHSGGYCWNKQGCLCM